MNNVTKCEYKNGVRRPLKGDTAEIWKVLDEYVKSQGYTPTLDELKELCSHINENTVRTQLCLYLRFNNIQTRRGDLKNGRSFVIA